MGRTSSRRKSKHKEVQPVNFVTWFEIPAINFEQSVRFYNFIYDMEMVSFQSNDYTMALFPSEGGVGGAIVCGPGSIPSATGALVYLNGGSNLNNILDKVEEAGGRVVMPKTFISEDAGYFAIFIDIEGNKLALHSKA